MASDYDPTEFVDSDFEAQKTSHGPLGAAAGLGGSQRAPTREEVDSKVADAQQKLSEIIRAKEELERERASLEETRRRQMELQTGREEMIRNLTRGVGLLEEAEFAARRDAEQMAASLAGLREALAKVQGINEEGWTKDKFSVELTRALTTIENGRMEWNTARLKFPVLSGQAPVASETAEPKAQQAAFPGDRSFGELCRLGLALTWPLVLVALAALGALLVLLLRP